MTNQLEQTTETIETSSTPETGEVAQEPQGPMWYEAIQSEELRNNKNITKFKSLDDFAAWQANASKLMGKRVNELKPEEVRQFLSPEELIQSAEQRGMPSSIDDYQLPQTAESLPADLAMEFKKIAMEEGVTPKQLERLAQENHKLAMAQHEAQKEQWINELIHTYGDRASEEMELAASAAKQFCSPELMKMLDQAGMGHNPEVVKAFAKVAREMLPDHIPRSNAITPDERVVAQKAIQELINDREFYSRWKRGEPKAVSQLNELYGKL